MNTVNSRHVSRLALITLAAAALLAIAFVTPQGRAFAQNILQLFRRSDSFTLPLPDGQFSDTVDDSAPTAMPPAPLVSVAEAEVTAGFNAKELPSIPQGFTFAGAMARAGGISIQYQAKGNGGQFGYQPDSGATAPMSSVGLLCMQYLGTRRTDLKKPFRRIANNHRYAWFGSRKCDSRA